MKKIHTRTKRKYGLSTSFRHKFFFKGVERKPRPKTFNSEEAAHNYAKSNNIKDYKLVNLRSPESSRKKIRIIIN